MSVAHSPQHSSHHLAYALDISRTDLDRSLGARVRARRGVLGLSQERLALSIDPDRTAIAKVEHGRRSVTLFTLAVRDKIGSVGRLGRGGGSAGKGQVNSTPWLSRLLFRCWTFRGLEVPVCMVDE